MDTSTTSACACGLVLLMAAILAMVPPSYCDSEQLGDIFFYNDMYTGDQAASDAGYRLTRLKSFIVLAPRQVRSERSYEIYVSVLELLSHNVTVRAFLSRDGVEYANGVVHFYDAGSQHLIVDVPTGVVPGDHRLTVTGHLGGQTGATIFKNVTDIEFQPKHISIFIQTDQPVYYPPQTMTFRIIGVTPEDLKPVDQGLTIYMRDARGIVVRRWRNQQLKFGVIQRTFDFAYPINIGTWHIVVEAFGHVYEQPFETVFYFNRRFEVNVTSPIYMFETEEVFRASIYGQHQTWKPAYGNASILLRCRDEDMEFLPGELTMEIMHLRGLYWFEFAMHEIRSVWPDIAGKSLVLEGWMYDWEFEETLNGTAITKVYADYVSLKRLGNQFLSFHPGKAFYAYFAMQRSDGTQYMSHENRSVWITVNHEGPDAMETSQDVILPDDSMIKFKVTPQMSDEKITVTAFHPQSASEASYMAFRYYSRKGRYITLISSSVECQTHEYLVLTVRTNFFVTDVYYVITANNNIELANQLTMNSQQKTFSVALSRSMVPRAHVVVYAIVEGEVIMDGMTFFVRDSLLTNATLQRNFGKDFSWNTVEFVGHDRKGSFMYLSAEVWEWWRRGASIHLTEDRVLRELWTYDEPNQAPFQHVWYHNDSRWDSNVFFNSGTSGRDPYSTLWASGLMVMTDMRVAFAQGEEIVCNATQGVGMCMDGSCYELAKRCDGFPDCPDGYDEAACPELEPPHYRPSEEKTLAGFKNLFEDSSWGFKSRYLNPRAYLQDMHSPFAQTELRVDVPKSYNLYVMHAFFMHPDHGLTLANNYILHNSTRRFFMTCEGPPILRRGEQLGVRCALFNMWDQYLEPIVTLHGGDEYVFVNVEDYGIVSSYAPRTTAGDVQAMVPMFPGDMKYFYIPIITLDDKMAGGGIEYSITISVTTVVATDSASIDIYFLPDGVLNDDYTPYIVDLFYNPSEYTPYFDIMVPDQFWNPEERELLYIPGSNWAVVNIYGNVVAPGFFEPYFTGDLATGLAQNTAQGYMFTFDINFLLIRYQFIVNELEDETKDYITDLLRTRIMGLHAYIHELGYVRMFRRTEDPCLWLTAFYLDSLHDVFVTEWVEDLYIPLSQLNKMALWLARQQDAEGRFIETSEKIYYRHYGPISMDRQGFNHTWHVAPTAYVTIVLAKASRLTGEAKSAAATAVTLASTYLASKAADLGDALQLALTTYALQLTGHSFKDDAFIMLQGMRKESLYSYWCTWDIPDSPYTVIDNKFKMESRPDVITLSNGVMATSYALLLYLDHGLFEESRQIMKWINMQHMSEISFAADQDSVVALQALTEYTKRETNHDFYQMEVTVEATSSPGWREVVQLNKSNVDYLFMIEVPEAWGEVMTYVKGTGFAVIGLYTEFYVEKPWQVYTPDYDTFTLDVYDLNFYGHNASIMEMTACTSWMRGDLAEESSMAMFTLDLPDGYVVDRNEVERLYTAGIPGLKRVKLNWTGVAYFLFFIFEYITQEGLCFTFIARRWYPVANMSIHHWIAMNEYTEPALQNFSGYTTYTLFNLDICKVCGSYQCTYCPWYNAAPPSVATSSTLLAIPISIALMTTTRWLLVKLRASLDR